MARRQRSQNYRTTLAGLAALGALALGCASEETSAVVKADSGKSDVQADVGQGGFSGGDASAEQDSSAGASGEGGSGGAAGEGGAAGGAGAGGEAGSAGGAGTGGSGGQEPGCDKSWRREICAGLGGDASVKVEVVDGAMQFEEVNSPNICGGPTMPQVPVKVFQGGLKGNFDVSFNFDSFSAGAKDASLQAYVMDSSNAAKIAVLSITKKDTGNELHASLSNGSSPQTDKKTVSANKGGFRFTRALSGILTITLETPAGKVSVGSLFSSGELSIGVAMRGPSPAVKPAVATTARVLDFVAASGSLKTDLFDCDSLN